MYVNCANVGNKSKSQNNCTYGESRLFVLVGRPPYVFIFAIMSNKSCMRIFIRAFFRECTLICKGNLIKITHNNWQKQDQRLFCVPIPKLLYENVQKKNNHLGGKVKNLCVVEEI